MSRVPAAGTQERAIHSLGDGGEKLVRGFRLHYGRLDHPRGAARRCSAVRFTPLPRAGRVSVSDRLQYTLLCVAVILTSNRDVMTLNGPT